MGTEMKRFLVLAFLFAFAPAHAAEVAGAKIDETARVAGTDLELNGAGVRSKAIFTNPVSGDLKKALPGQAS